MMFVLISVVASLVSCIITHCIITHWIYKWRNPKCKGKLPPGSMGFPLLGESMQFFAPYRANKISHFYHQENGEMEFGFGAKILPSYSESKSSKNLRQAYADFQHGLISFPLNVPGNACRKRLQGRKKAVEIIKSTLEERRATPETRKEREFLDLDRGNEEKREFDD